MDTAKGLTSMAGFDIRMGTAKSFPSNDDIRMETARGVTVKQNRLPLRDRELLETAEVKRKATVAQLCEC